MQVPLGSCVTLITKTLQQKQCLWLWSSRAFSLSLILQVTSLIVTPLWFLQNTLQTISDTNIWLWDINSPHLDSSSTPAKIFITLPLLLQSDMFAHDHNWSMMHSEKTKWSNIRFDSAGIGPLKWSTRAKSGGQSSCLLRCKLESHDLALSYTWVMNLMKLYVN